MHPTLRGLKNALSVVTLAAMLLPAMPAAASFGQRDVLIKGPGTGAAVYYLAADGKRYVFPNQKTYLSWFKDFSGVLAVSYDDLITFPLGGNVTCRPGVRLVKITSDPRVYAVDHGGVLRWVRSEAAAASLYGSTWATTKVDDVPDAFFTNYLIGADIVSASSFTPSVASASSTTINADKGLPVSANPRQSDTTPSVPASPPPVVPPSSQSCTADVWECTTWSTCDSSGTQTRTCSLSTDCPNAASSTPAQSQACTPTHTSGTISVSADPLPGDVEAGTDADLARFRFTASYEDLKLTKVSFNVASPLAATSLSLYDGAALVAPAQPVGSDGNVYFSNIALLVPKNAVKTLTVRGHIGDVGPTGAPTGANAKVTMRDSSPYQFMLQGVAGSSTAITVIPGGEKAGDDKIVVRSVPTISVASLPSTVLTYGDVIAARFKIAAGRVDMAVKSLTFDIQKPNGANIAVTGAPGESSVRVYGSGQNLPGAAAANAGCNSGGGTSCQVRVLFDDEQIGAGSTKTYDLRLTIAGALAGGDSLATSLLGDGTLASGALTAGSYAAQVRVGGTDVNFAWSDMSAIPHSATVGSSSDDWTSGIYLKVLPTDTQVLVK